ncbi:OmpA family protein [Bradyrhizobium sp.]|uniref:OmpA family protein n=1 Tax=Bradyrhizobium sp. TaxID=376 RepID=UPI0023A07E49|nr:OmpA family protein [Bradyrhizobium sp.]MDE1933929.1 OmpA family protein [Bradyrhizobium sp.]
MSRHPAKIVFVAAVSLLAIGAALSLGAANAEDVTEDQVLKALTPQKKPLTRSLSMVPPAQSDPASEAEGKLMQSLRNRSTRSLSMEEREQIAAIVKSKPNIDLEINFDYNSDRISARSLRSVQALGRALANPELKGSIFIVAGHTDAAGGEEYNLNLSERRADSIKHYLVEKSGIPAADLITVGYGKTKLKDPAHPLSEVNRRVQVVNTENKTTASK